ncbi:MAG: ribosome maturation factor RimM [Acidobacteria bacterium]|nr:ribosome maturation factor RimM [Acidobacteriota bacterium]MCI0625364.1 ribosome maturation factor RimM [Acidobacteriota bacterium]MCI0720409.1 ribosome maturation factor RimM [Acidobacteriota bacterium]
MQDSPHVSVARIIKTQGNRGEVAADILTDFPERFQHLSTVTLEKEGQAPLELIVESHWFHKQRVILKFRGIDAITPAERLVGYEVMIAKSQLMALQPGSYYQHDLVGCRIEDESGMARGNVVEVLGSPGNYLLRVSRDTGDFLVPFAQSYFPKIDVRNKVLVCDLPEGLEDL